MLLMAVEKREPVHLRASHPLQPSGSPFGTPDVGLPFTFVSSKLLRCKWIGWASSVRLSETRRWRLPFRSFRGAAFSSKLAPLMVRRLKPPLAAVDLPENYGDRFVGL